MMQAGWRLKRFKGKVIAVVGSVGKTSTTQAVAQVLSSKRIVLATSGNLNTEFGLPMIVLEIEPPKSAHSPIAWLTVVTKGFLQSWKPLTYDVLVLEMGTDKPGDLKKFKHAVKPDISIVTAVSAEHMENFQTLENVLKEELTVLKFSKTTLINTDNVPHDGIPELAKHKILTYGTGKATDYTLEVTAPKFEQGFELKLQLKEKSIISNCPLFGAHSLLSVLAAAAVAEQLGFDDTDIGRSIALLKPLPGRMQLLQAVESKSYVIDDSYNSSPLAAQAALDTLYALDVPQRIAVLGSMNELGAFSVKAHQSLGAYCKSDKLEFVVTIGKEAKDYLGPAAKKAGCVVRSFDTAPEAGRFVLQNLKPGAVVLVKGSQNGVFAEEAIKMILKHSEDESKLVRQTDEWLEIKREQGLVA